MKIKFIFVALFILALKSYAHKVNVFAYIEGNKVHCESYYSDGSKVKEGLVEVFNKEGKKLLDGKTDAEGNFSFVVPEKTDLKIVVNASMGHRAETTIHETELPKIKKEIAKKQEEVKSISTEEIKKVVEEAIEEKLHPVYKMLAKQNEQKGISVTEVIGGIGYIIGIIGIIAFFMRKKKDDK